MKEYIAIAEISYYNSINSTTEEETIVLTEVASYADAMTRVEAYYREDLEAAKITLLEGPYITISNDSIDKLMKGEEI